MTNNRTQTKNNKPLTQTMYNCRAKNKCPLSGNCLQNNVIYQATVKSKGNEKKVCIGITEGPWKQRKYAHKTYFTNSKYANAYLHCTHTPNRRDDSYRLMPCPHTIEGNNQQMPTKPLSTN